MPSSPPQIHEIAPAPGGKAKMRTRQRPVSQGGPPQTTHTAAPCQPRKIFNCIVDDSALVAGVKRSTRNGIRQWVKSEQIRLFVSLHALEELSCQKGGKNKHAEDVRETLQWLDEATTKYPNVVTLQGADETYERWDEVEKFSVPRTLFSEDDHDHDHDHDHEAEQGSQSTDVLPEDIGNKQGISHGIALPSVSSGASDVSRSLSRSSRKSARSSISPVSPPTSPAKAVVSPTKHMISLAAVATRPQSSSNSVPQNLQPLFNYILWRIHQENDPIVALESFIFLCNDPRKVNFAKGFDIKAKRLEQLREAVGREDRDFRNRQALLDRENQDQGNGQAEAGEATSKLSPPTAPAAMLQKQQSNVIDPNAFGRGLPPQPAGLAGIPNGIPKSPRGQHASPQRSSPRIGSSLPFAPRGNMHAHPRGSLRGGPRGRGGSFVPGRGGFPHFTGTADEVATQGQIDPDSFARPDTRGVPNGRRGGRKLWVPT